MSCFHFICWETFAGHLNYLVKEGWDAQIGQGPHQWKATWFPCKDPPQPHTLNLLCRWDCIWVARLGGQRVVLDATWSFLGRSGWINLRNTRISLEIRKRYEFGHQPHRTFFLPVPSCALGPCLIWHVGGKEYRVSIWITFIFMALREWSLCSEV